MSGWLNGRFIARPMVLSSINSEAGREPDCLVDGGCDLEPFELKSKDSGLRIG